MAQNTTKENSHSGHRVRLKQRFLSEGLDAFNEHQILELLLFYTIPLKDTNEIAHDLIKTFGSLSRVFDAHPKELQKVHGISEHSSTLISMTAFPCVPQGPDPGTSGPEQYPGCGRIYQKLFHGPNL